MGFIFLGITLAVLLLLIHQKYIQSDQYNLEYVQDPCRQWFRLENAANCTRCSHEMAMIVLLLVGVIAIFIITLNNCGGRKN